MLNRGHKRYQDVQIEVDGIIGYVGFQVRKLRDGTELKGFWKVEGGEWQRLTSKPVSGSGAKGQIIKLGKEALGREAESLREQRAFRESMVFVICGPSCGGKTTLADTLVKRHTNKFRSVITTTTRYRRDGERNGRDYRFVSVEQFANKMDAGCFIEYDRVNGHLYGIDRGELKRASEDGRSAVIVATPAALQPLKEWCDIHGKSLTTIFVSAKDEVLLARMLRRYRADSENSANVYVGRINRLFSEELLWRDRFEFDIVGDTETDKTREAIISKVMGKTEVGLLRLTVNQSERASELSS